MPSDAPLRIAYLTYRGKPHVGGQGVYTRHLAKALVDLGHHVEVLGGQPYPILDERVPAGRAAQPRHLQRPLPDAAARDLGAEELEGLPRGHRLHRSAPSPSRSPSRCGPGTTSATARTTSTSSRTTSASATACSSSSASSASRCSAPSTTRSPSTGASRSRPPRAGTRSSPCAAGTPSSTCRRRWPAGSSGSSRCRRTPSRTSSHDHKVDPDRMAVVPVGVDIDLFRPLPEVAVGARAASSPPRRPTWP